MMQGSLPSVRGSKARSAAAQRPSAPSGGRFRDGGGRNAVGSGPHHNVQTNTRAAPTRGRALRGGVPTVSLAQRHAALVEAA